MITLKHLPEGSEDLRTEEEEGERESGVVNLVSHWDVSGETGIAGIPPAAPAHKEFTQTQIPL